VGSLEHDDGGDVRERTYGTAGLLLGCERLVILMGRRLGLGYYDDTNVVLAGVNWVGTAMAWSIWECDYTGRANLIFDLTKEKEQGAEIWVLGYVLGSIYFHIFEPTVDPPCPVGITRKCSMTRCPCSSVGQHAIHVNMEHLVISLRSPEMKSCRWP
jgi:hypothetical protein